MSLPRIFRTKKTKVGSLTSYKNEKPEHHEEAKVSKEEVNMEESGLGDIFQDIYGESGTEIPPGEVSTSASKPHVRRHDEPEDEHKLHEEPPARMYSGEIVQEGVNPTKASEVEDSDLDDLISLVLDSDGDPPRPTSTPSKDDGDDIDFAEGLSLIRDDDGGVPEEKTKPKEKDDRDNKSVRRDEKPMPYEGLAVKPLSSGSSTITTTTSKISYSSKFVTSIPDSFYKELQSRLEDLIFKFECLDNEYAALQKISHNIHGETVEIKKKLYGED